MDGFCLFRSLLLLFFLSVASPHMWQSENEWSPEDGWRRTAQISATVRYNSRTLQGTLVELPVQMPRSFMVFLQKNKLKPLVNIVNIQILILLHSQTRPTAGWCFFFFFLHPRQKPFLLL